MAKKYALTKEQVEQFRRDGFIGPLDLYDSDEIKALYMNKLRAEMFDRSKAVYELEHTSRLAGYDRHLDSDFFSQHVMRREIVDKLEQILGPDVICWRSEMFPKYPGDEGTDWHQADNFGHASGSAQIQWPNGSEFGGAVTVWTAITDVTEETAALRFIPGTHEEMFYDESKEMRYSPENENKLEKGGMKRGFFGYDYRNLQKDPDWVPDESAAVSMIMKAGQFVVFWSTLMHSSFPNTTKNKTRLGFTARYLPTSVKVYPNTNTLDEYGTVLSLDKFGCVLVAGEDRFGYNRMLTQSTRGYQFKIPAQ